MNLYSEGGVVLGLDINILDHTVQKLKPWVEKKLILMFERDSASSSASSHIKRFLQDNVNPVLVVLDSNHTHEHVYN